MSSDKISACWDVLCFVDKAIIHHYGLDSKSHSPSQAYASYAQLTHWCIFADELYLLLLLIAADFLNEWNPVFELHRKPGYSVNILTFD